VKVPFLTFSFSSIVAIVPNVIVGTRKEMREARAEMIATAIAIVKALFQDIFIFSDITDTYLCKKA
tara:strand:- start:110 stop:307 length:198 start_codon:yes stop_codon:yes gene_type:complete